MDILHDWPKNEYVFANEKGEIYNSYQQLIGVLDDTSLMQSVIRYQTEHRRMVDFCNFHGITLEQFRDLDAAEIAAIIKGKQ